MAKKNTKNTKGAKKAAAKKPAKKTATKKAASKKKAAPKRVVRKNAIVLLWGGVLKANHVVAFAIDSAKKDEIDAHVFDTYVSNYSNGLSGKFVKCVDAEDSFAQFTNDNEETLVAGTDNLYNLSISSATTLVKELEGTADQAVKLSNFTEYVAEEESEEDEESAEDEESEEEVEEDSAEDEESADEESEEESEEEEPAPKKKRGAKKNTRKRK